MKFTPSKYPKSMILANEKTAEISCFNVYNKGSKVKAALTNVMANM